MSGLVFATAASNNRVVGGATSSIRETGKKERLYRLDQAVMLGECGLVKEANQQAEQALVYWGNNKVNNFLPDFNLVMEVAQKDDLKFSTNLLNVYQLANCQEEAIKLQ
ncbi:hypothetical protein [Moorena sp. SIO3I6]|uniref:hypothetical protein n=1 Tax=Moorena sp. SIO3I6 TaxID=2607831 RepID=UPI0013FB0D07|nr:hypothetical protein [Moorena sp. SIO3I6]NEP27249.1 hypothetical protein [Moorena sp. SIO3I6]